MWMALSWWQTQGMELQTMLEVVQACVIRWRIKFNSKKSKIMLVGKREGGTSWKIGEEAMEEVEEFKYLGVWFDRKLRGNVHLEKIVKKAEERVGKVTWMSRVNVQVEVDKKGVVGAYQKNKFGAYCRNVVVRRA